MPNMSAFNPQSAMAPAAQLAPYAKMIALPGLDLNVCYFEAGAQHCRTLILIHGLQDEADTWRHVFEPLARTHRVIALDLPGFGRSDKPRRPYDVFFYVRALLAFMDALKVGYADLMGSSLGAIVAEVLTLTHPARVSRLILLDGTINIVERPAANPLQLLLLPVSDRRYFEALRRAPQAAYDSLRPYYADLDALPQADRDFLSQRVNARVWDEPQRLAALSIRMRLPWFVAFLARRLVQRIPSMPAPTLVIWGEQDRILPISNGVIRAALQPKVRLVRIPCAGHLPHQEQPAAVLEALLKQGHKPAA